MVNFNSNRTYGVEIEMSWGEHGTRAPSQQVVAEAIRMAGLECNVVNSYSNAHDSNSNTAWKIVRDGSVTNGHELVSPILRGLDGKEQLKKAMQAVKAIGAVVHKSCGVHVHHGVHDFTAKQLANVAEIYRNNEPTIDKLVAVSRRNVHWAQSMDNGVNYFENASAVTLNGEWSNSRHDRIAKNSLETAMVNGKYYKVNFRAFVRQGTVEFRQHQSSLNAIQIWNWIVFTQMIVESAKGKRGKANKVTVNTGNPETAGERALIRDLNMRKRIDPRSGRQNYDDTTINALRGLARKRQVGMVNRHGQNMQIGLDINLRSGAVEDDSAEVITMTAEQTHAATCSGNMVERTNRQTGEAFMGCTNYRRGCRYSINMVAA
jgi:hypothetical protein